MEGFGESRDVWLTPVYGLLNVTQVGVLTPRCNLISVYVGEEDRALPYLAERCVERTGAGA